MKVYVLIGEWCIGDAGDNFVEVYDSYEKAIAQFNKQVTDDIESAWFNSLVDEEITACPGYWEVYQDDCNYARYEIIKKEVK